MGNPSMETPQVSPRKDVGFGQKIEQIQTPKDSPK